MACTMIGPLGGLREVSLVQRGATVDTARAGSEMVTLGGRRIVQRAPRGPRSWGMSLGAWRTPAQLAYLASLATGTIPGPHYLYTQDAAQSNLLPADIAAPGALAASGLLRAGGDLPMRGRVMVSVGGVLTPMVGVDGDSVLPGEWSRLIPLPLGSYVLSGYRTTTGQALLWRTVSATGTTVATGTLSSSGGARGTSAVTVSGSAVALQARLPILSTSDAIVGGFRLTAGTTQTTDWLPGRGVPQVVIDDPQEVLQMVTAGEVRSDYTVTIREVD